MDWAAYVQKVHKARRCGLASGAEHVWTDGPRFDLLTDWLREAGYAVPAELPQQPLTTAEARQFMVDILSRSLTYDLAVHSIGKAEALADEYLSFHPAGTLYYTNGTLTRSRRNANNTGTWIPLTDSTFDTGLLSLTNDFARVIWFEEED